MQWRLVALLMAGAVVTFTSAQGYYGYYGNNNYGYYPRYDNYYGNSGYGNNGYYNGYASNGYNYIYGYNGYNNGYYNNNYNQQQANLLPSLFSLFGSSSGSSSSAATAAASSSSGVARLNAAHSYTMSVISG
ncbi:hypothetical protein AAVH_24553 [Aphelenchoides avenae]|nr:hypothetical protein AAVH_24553 [Aphelenchus avenae]